MYPLSAEVEDLVERWCTRDVKQADQLIKSVYQWVPPPQLDALVSIFNYARHHPQKSSRHIEIESIFGKFFRKEHFLYVPEVGPLAIDTHCYIIELPSELIKHIFSFLALRSTLRFGLTCRTFCRQFYDSVAHNPMQLSKYVADRLSNPCQIRRLFAKRVYNTPYALQVGHGQVRHLSIFNRFPNAVRLSFHLGELNDALFKNFIKRTPQLSCCSLNDVQVTDHAVQALRTRAQTLKELRLLNCSQITRAAFDIEQPFLHVRVLALTLKHFTDADVAQALQCCPNVTHLRLKGCIKVNGAAIAGSERVKFLEELHLGGTAVEDQHYIAIVSGAEKMHKLNISHCDELTAQAFRDAAYQPALKKFYADCSNIDDVGLAILRSSCTLQEIDLSNCFRLTQPQL